MLSSINVFTELGEDLIIEIEDKSNVELYEKISVKEGGNTYIRLLKDGAECIMICDCDFDYAILNNFTPLTNKQFVKKCIELAPKKKGKWVPDYRETYWYVDNDGDIEDTENDEMPQDLYLIKTNKAFKTEKICELAQELDIAKAEYENAVREFNGDWVPDWGDSNKKWEINLNICDCVERSYIYHLRCVETAHFKSDPMASENWEEIKQLYLNYYNAKQAFEKAKREV